MKRNAKLAVQLLAQCPWVKRNAKLAVQLPVQCPLGEQGVNQDHPLLPSHYF